MRIVKLSGGLGNQMFQYVFGQYISKKYKEKIYYDISWYKNQRPNKKLSFRNFELLSLTLDINILPIKQVLFRSNALDTLLYLLKGLFSEKRKNYNIVYESRKTLIGNLFKFIFRNRYHIGYWQDYKYFLETSEEIEFKLKSNQLLVNKKIKNKILNSNSISIGVRRGDYVKLGLIVCNIDYYTKAINLIIKSVKNPTFYVFSDDIEWCKKNLRIPSSHFFVDSNLDTSFENIELMNACNHNIISNSTYDWWGAILNKNCKKIVICPKIWSYNNPRLTKSLLPKEWIKI